uniref:F5/8 type C domain-containing protein n=1 Tax=Clytia hemisphaerica TaxID=252671 RepID=A0A7M6DP97_9CNID
EREGLYSRSLLINADLKTSYVPIPASCQQFSLNRRTAFYFRNVKIPKHAKIHTANSGLYYDNLQVTQRSSNGYLFFNVRIYIGLDENFVKSCHYRWDVETHFLLSENFQSRKLDTKYFRLFLGKELQKVFNSPSWRYGMSIIIYIEPMQDLPAYEVMVESPWSLKIWYQQVCDDFKEDLVNNLPLSSFSYTGSPANCDDPSYIKFNDEENHWTPCDGSHLVLQLSGTPHVTMIAIKGRQSGFVKKFELFHSLDGSQYHKIKFSSKNYFEKFSSQLEYLSFPHPTRMKWIKINVLEVIGDSPSMKLDLIECQATRITTLYKFDENYRAIAWPQYNEYDDFFDRGVYISNNPDNLVFSSAATIDGLDYIYLLHDSGILYTLRLLEYDNAEPQDYIPFEPSTTCQAIDVSPDGILWCLDFNGDIYEFDRLDGNWHHQFNVKKYGSIIVRNLAVTMTTLEWLDADANLHTLHRVNVNQIPKARRVTFYALRQGWKKMFGIISVLCISMENSIFISTANLTQQDTKCNLTYSVRTTQAKSTSFLRLGSTMDCLICLKEPFHASKCIIYPSLITS